MTTSLSNGEFILPETKVIKIKPITIDQPVKENPLTTERDQLKVQIQQYQQELEKLKAVQATLLTNTRQQIEQEKAEWQQEKQHLMEQAQAEGYQAGFQAGQAEGLALYEDQIAQANAIIEKAKEDYFDTVQKSDETILELAIHVAEKILQQQLASEPKSFLPIVLEAIESIKDQSEVVIYLHPANYDAVIEQKDELVQSLDGDTKLSIFIDHKLAENQCIIEHPFGQIDASIDTQLHQLRKALQDAMMEEGE